MPFVNVENSGKGNNKGSCRALVNYLCKENRGKTLIDQEHFFNHSEAQVNRLHVITSIDSNIQKLGKEDSKFFMVTMNFSQPELRHLDNDLEKVKAYSLRAMDLYAANFKKGLRSVDLVWFGKVENNRAYKGFEPEVQDGKFKQGELKHGYNTHVHFVISRKDKTQKLKLSPMTNHRQSSSGPIKSGFDRMNFKVECESLFDKMFNYPRAIDEHVLVINAIKNGSSEERRSAKEAVYAGVDHFQQAMNSRAKIKIQQ